MRQVIHKEFTFDASHRLVNLKKSAEWNKEVYGKCNNKPSHGHTFRMVVELSGEINNDTGFIVNFVDLKRMVNELIIEKLDHHFINEVDFMKGKLCTCENLVEEVWKILNDYLISNKADYYLKELVIYETTTSSIMEKVEETELAWVAEFIDGDGTILLSKRAGRIEIYNTNLEALNKAKQILGSRDLKRDYIYSNKGFPRRKPGYHTTINKQTLLKHTLIKILPYLVEKREQGKILLEYLNLRKKHPRFSLKEKKKLSSLVKRMKAVNQRGRK